MTTTEIKAGKRTPGPWTIAEYGIAEVGAKYLCIKKGGKTVSRIDPQGNSLSTNDTDYANARLIAAAPELLEALRRIMEYAHLGASVCDIDVNEQPQFVNVRAAISKAEGK